MLDQEQVNQVFPELCEILGGSPQFDDKGKMCRRRKKWKYFKSNTQPKKAETYLKELGYLECRDYEIKLLKPARGRYESRWAFYLYLEPGVKTRGLKKRPEPKKFIELRVTITKRDDSLLDDPHFLGQHEEFLEGFIVKVPEKNWNIRKLINSVYTTINEPPI